MKRELDSSESNLRDGWFGIKSFWMEVEVKGRIKVRVERALVVEQGRRVRCGRYKRGPKRWGIGMAAVGGTC